MTPALTHPHALRLGALGLGLVLSLGACSPEAPSPAPAKPAAPATAEAPIAPAQPAPPVSCLTDIGEPAAKRLVERCIAVSPATRPPCNVQNSCDTIQNEIDRGCGFFEAHEKPAECAA